MKNIVIVCVGLAVITVSPILCLSQRGRHLVKEAYKALNYIGSKCLYKHFRYQCGEYKKEIQKNNIKLQHLLDIQHI